MTDQAKINFAGPMKQRILMFRPMIQVEIYDANGLVEERLETPVTDYLIGRVGRDGLQPAA